MIKRLLRRPSARALLVGMLGRYLKFALRTTRWTLHGAEHLAPHAAGQPAVAAFWHERLPLMPALWTIIHKQAAPAGIVVPNIYVLVSRHSDGRVIGEMLRLFGVDVVHGSTARNGKDRGGAAGVRALLEVLEGGSHVVITPDGPRGPRRKAALGVAQLAALSGVPVLPCTAQIWPRIVLNSWDRMVLPLPFGRGVIVCGPSIAVPREGWEAFLPVISQAMTDAADRADALCR
jgi:lysophospholipid acyltransferase (LPLAT)-like uncharacterized protein